MTAGGWRTLSRPMVACVVAVPVALTVGVPAAHAKDGDTHITSVGSNQTIDCNDSTSSNTIIADDVVNDITVYGSDQAVFYKSGDPVVWDRGRELGMMNRIDRIPA